MDIDGALFDVDVAAPHGVEELFATEDARRVFKSDAFTRARETINHPKRDPGVLAIRPAGNSAGRRDLPR